MQEEDTEAMLAGLAAAKKAEGDGLDGLAMQASLVTLSSIKNLGQANFKEYMTDTSNLYRKP
jgi:hypothetical protein